MPEPIATSIARLRERQREAHRFDEWARPERPESAVHDFTPDAPPGLLLLEARPHVTDYHALRVTRYVFAEHGGEREAGTVVEAIVAECESSELARESILDVLASLSANMLTRREQAEEAVGDITFAPPMTESPYVLFARRNVMVQVMSIGGVDVPVLTVAQALDSQILDPAVP
jgi:hypothetical protein